jgi:Flp pilus assembly protein TadG
MAIAALSTGAFAMKAMLNSKKVLRDETGQVLVIAALSMTGLLGFMALATDVGVLLRSRRSVQTAADAAATAAALNYLHTASTSSAIAAGKAAAGSNGVTDGTGGAAVTISIPPADGPNAGSALFAESQVSKPSNTIFMGMFGFHTMTVGARAVAGTPTNGAVCIWIMAPSGASMELQGSYNIQAPGCGIYVNSPSSQAFGDIGNGGTVNAAFLDVVGNSPPAHQTSPTPTTVNAAPRKSPWGNFDGDSPSDCTHVVDTSAATGTPTITSSNMASVVTSYMGAGNVVCFSGAVTFQGVTIGSASTAQDANGHTVYTADSANRGTLLFENGLTLSGTNSIYGAALDMYAGNFSQGNAVLNIVAPTAGKFAGLALVMSTHDTTSTCQDPHTTTPCMQVQFGSGTSSVEEGYIYAPGAELYMQDNGGGVTASGIVAKTMYEKSSPLSINFNYDSEFPGVTPNRVVTLVE